MKMMIPLNTDGEGCSKTVLAGYYKFGCATLLGDTFGTSGTAVIEVYDNTVESSPERDGTARAIKAQYYKTSAANFLRTGTWGATGVIEVYEESDSDQYRGGELQDADDSAGSVELGELSGEIGSRRMGLSDD